MALTYTDFLAMIQRDADIGRDAAERVARAMLTTLAQRISPGEARDIAEQLPEELRSSLRDGGGPQPFSADEFLRRVQSRAQLAPDAVRRHVRAVFAALRQALRQDELADLASELPRELEALLLDEPALADLEAPPDGQMTAQEFIDRVARRAAIDHEAAGRATEAVLQTLAYKISGGEVEDLLERLPAELHPPLQHGRVEGGESARLMPLKQFLIAVAEREGVTRAQARLHTRAVFATLREAAGAKEMDDILSQMPQEYRSLLPRPVSPVT
ncbi:MAG: hypothetical protein QOD83_1264 [Solirubrobacteraceae bacterium]|jgi:uncharacterized protein (DUF2267 family)|nr:hypothetical protein [Solirubrobacteraceae bacterium]